MSFLKMRHGHVSGILNGTAKSVSEEAMYSKTWIAGKGHARILSRRAEFGVRKKSGGSRLKDECLSMDDILTKEAMKMAKYAGKEAANAKRVASGSFFSGPLGRQPRIDVIILVTVPATSATTTTPAKAEAIAIRRGKLTPAQAVLWKDSTSGVKGKFVGGKWVPFLAASPPAKAPAEILSSTFSSHTATLPVTNSEESATSEGGGVQMEDVAMEDTTPIPIPNPSHLTAQIAELKAQIVEHINDAITELGQPPVAPSEAIYLALTTIMFWDMGLRDRYSASMDSGTPLGLSDLTPTAVGKDFQKMEKGIDSRVQWMASEMAMDESVMRRVLDKVLYRLEAGL